MRRWRDMVSRILRPTLLAPDIVEMILNGRQPAVHAKLRFHADLHGLERATVEARIDHELARFDLGAGARRMARELSGGSGGGSSSPGCCCTRRRSC
jgi:hypothetical protein